MTSVLAFDTSGPWCSVAISVNKNIVYSASDYLPRGHSEVLLPKLMQCLDEAKMTLRQIDLVSTITGPGSFTGLRVGIGCAQGIALGLAKPLIGIDAFKVYAYCIPFNNQLLVVIDSQKDEVYCQLFNADKSANKRALALKPEDITTYLGGNKLVITGSGMERVNAYIRDEREKIIYSPTTSIQLVEKLCALAQKEQGKTNHICLPTYLKKPMINVKKRHTNS